MWKFVYRILPKLVKKCGRYGYKLIHFLKDILTLLKLFSRKLMLARLSEFYGNQPKYSVADVKLQMDGSGLHVRHSYLTS